jgi:uncharacterized protein
MKLKILIIILLLILFGVIFFTQINFGQKLKTSQVVINNKVINVELAQTPSRQEKGLGGRDFLVADSGMLFIFSDLAIRIFWMKDMEFPLDIIWIKDNTIIGITANVPVPISQENLPIYASPAEVNYVLEVNAGFCEKNNFKIGDKANLNLR